MITIIFHNTRKALTSISLFYAILALCFTDVVAQHDVDKEREDLHYCRVQSGFYSDTVTQLFKDDKLTGLDNIYRNWKNNCGNIEPVERLGILNSIFTNPQKEIDYSDNIIENLLIYRAIEKGFFDGDTVYYLPFQKYMGYPVLHENFNLITKKISNELLTEGLSQTQKMFCRFYKGKTDSFFHHIQLSEYENSRLNMEYDEYVNAMVRDSVIIHVGIAGGIWIPTGKNKILGQHPTIGFQFGIKNHKGYSINLSMILRLRNASNTIILNFQDTLRETNKMLGGEYGISLGKDIYRDVKNEINVFTGLSIDGLTSTVAANGVIYDEHLSHLGFSLGASYRRIFKQTGFIEFQPRYNFVSYDTNGGTDLSGHTISIRLLFGFLSGGYIRSAKLKSLEYIY